MIWLVLLPRREGGSCETISLPMADRVFHATRRELCRVVENGPQPGDASVGRFRGWRSWYMLSVLVLCLALSVPFIVASVVIDSDGRGHFGSTPYWGMVLALICIAVATTYVVAAVCAILPKIRRLRESSKPFPGDQDQVKRG